MAQASGSNAQILIAEESTYGTAGTVGYIFKNALYGESVGATIEELQSNSINASRSVQSTKAGNADGGGSIPFELNTEGPAWLWTHILGPVSTSGAGPYTHVFKRGALATSFTMEKGFTDTASPYYHEYTGCRIESLQVSITTEGLIAGSLEVKTQGKPTTSGASFDASPTDLGHSVLHHSDVTAFNEGGIGAVSGLGIEFTITNTLDSSQYTIGSQNRGSIPEGKGEVTGTITVPFTDEVLFGEWLVATSSSIDVTITNGTSSLKFDMGSVEYNGDGCPKIETTQGLVVAVPFRAIYNSGDATDIIVTLINDEATA